MTINLSSNQLDLIFQPENNRVRWERLASGGCSWLQPGGGSGIFGAVIDGQFWDATCLEFTGTQEDITPDGVRQVGLIFEGPGFTLRQGVKVYPDSALVEFCPAISNSGVEPIRVERVDSLALDISSAGAELFSFSSNWGHEFEPHHELLSGEVILESRAGRSSRGNHPWFALFSATGQVLSGSVAWSGNWVFRFEAREGGHRLSGGLHDWQFAKVLAPGETMAGAPVVLALGESLNAVSQAYARVGRRYWYPRSALAARLPVEWNHWWPYEDVEINASTFARNVAAAEALGIEVCTLDAGWFGPSDAGTFWGRLRGDWDQVNAERFPGGLRSLADDVHARGMKFGIWCEIEGLGEDAQLALDHPDYVALRDGERVGCVCFGNPQVQDWAYQTLARLITEYQSDWIKLDYNLDQKAGCNRVDHGHQAGDGQYAHYCGYYAMLERIRRDFPEVVLENCSSGGLRIDLGLMRRTDMAFLSDADWPEHDLQIFWGASTMLSADRLLHWTYSHWRSLNLLPQQKFDPRDPGLTVKKWDYYTRISMLGLYGLSQRLPDLPGWLSARIKENNRIYQRHVRNFVRQADLYRLTDQPLRSGEGERWPAFQYSLLGGSSHLLFVFRLPGAEPVRAVRLQALEPERVYQVEGLEGEFSMQMTGQALMEEGLVFSRMDEEESALLKIA